MENHREIQSKCDLCLKRYSRDGGHIRTRMKYIGCEHFSCRTCTNELKGSNDHFECPFCSRVIMECSEDLVFDRILDLLVDLEADLAEKTEFLKNLRNKEHDGFSMKRRYTFSELEKEEVKSKPYRIIEVYPRQVETTDNRSKSKEHKNPSNTTPRLSSHSNGNEGFFTSNKSEMTRMHTMNKQPYSTIYEQNESDSKHHHYSHNDNTHHRYPIVYNRNTDGGVEGYRENREYMDDELITSDGMYRYMGKEVMEMKGKERIEASVSAIKARRDKEMKRLEDMFDVKYVSRHERQRNDDRHIDKTRVKLGGDVIHGDYGLVLNRRFKSPLIPGYSPGEKYVVEKKREKKNGKGEGHIERKEGVAIVFSPIDSSLVVQDRIGRDMVRNLRSRVMDINKYNKKNMFFTKDANQNSLDQKLNVSSNQRFDKLKTMLTNPPLLRDIVTSTITSLKSKPEFKDLNLDPSSFDYHNISRSLERKPNRRFDIPKDRNLELYHLSYKFVRPNTIFDKSNINNGQKKNQIQENRRGKKTFDDTLNVNTLPYLYISPSI